MKGASEGAGGVSREGGDARDDADVYVDDFDAKRESFVFVEEIFVFVGRVSGVATARVRVESRGRFGRCRERIRASRQMRKRE